MPAVTASNFATFPFLCTNPPPRPALAPGDIIDLQPPPDPTPPSAISPPSPKMSHFITQAATTSTSTQTPKCVFGPDGEAVIEAVERLIREGIKVCWVVPKSDVAFYDLAKAKTDDAGVEIGALKDILHSKGSRRGLRMISLRSSVTKPGSNLVEWEQVLGDTDDMVVARMGAVGVTNAYLISESLRAQLRRDPLGRFVAVVNDSQLRELLQTAVPGSRGQHVWNAGYGPGSTCFSPIRFQTSIRAAVLASTAARTTAARSAVGSRTATAATPPTPKPPTPRLSYLSAISRPPPPGAHRPSTEAMSAVARRTPPHPITQHPSPALHVAFPDANTLIRPDTTPQKAYKAFELNNTYVVVVPKAEQEVRDPEARLWLKEFAREGGDRVRVVTHDPMESSKRVLTLTGESVPATTDMLIRAQAIAVCREIRPATATLISGDRAMVSHWDGLRDLNDPAQPQTLYHGALRPDDRSPKREWAEAQALHQEGHTADWLAHDVLPSEPAQPRIGGSEGRARSGR